MSENQPAPRRRRSDVYYQNQTVPQQTPSALQKKETAENPQNGMERDTAAKKTLRDAPVFPSRPPEKTEKDNDLTPAAKAGVAVRGTKEHRRLNTKNVPQMDTNVPQPNPVSKVHERVGSTGYHPARTASRPAANQPAGMQDSRVSAGYRQSPVQQGTNNTPVQQAMYPPAYPNAGSYPMQPSTGYRAAPGYQQAPVQQSANYPQMSGTRQAGYPGYQRPNAPLTRSGYIPPVIPPVQGGQMPPEPPKKPQKPKKRVRIPSFVIWIAVIAILFGLGSVILNAVRTQQARSALEASVHAYDTKYCRNVYVDGIDLSGMTQEEAADAVIAHAQEENNAWSVRLTYNGETLREITASDVNITIDVNDALSQAWSQGHTGTDEERKAAMDALEETPFYAYTAEPSKDTSNIDSILSNLRSQFYQPAESAYLVSFTPGATDPFTIQQEVPGRTLDIDAIRTQLYEMISEMTSGSIELTPVEIQPDITTADVRATVSLRGSATTDISTTSTENRNNNIRRAFELVSGTILAPGESFSFNGVVGERSKANGFYEAPEIVYGEMTDGVGGGVCQASTTIYQAAVRAGLKITDRTPHSEKANYCDYGMDATVYWYDKRRIDLKFTNNTDGNIYIVAAVQSKSGNRKRLITKVDIYGLSLGDTTYDLVNELVEELPYQTENRRDKDKKYVNYTDETYTSQEGADGYVYNSYRVTYVNGVETERTLLYKDTYKARNEIIYTGTSSRD